MRSALLLLAGLVLHAVLQLGPAWDKVSSAKHGRDFASYYYALQVAADGGDPYDTHALDVAAREDRTRKSVHPYFYPPPFLLAIGWARPLSLHQAYVGMLLLNEALLFGCLFVLVRAFAVPVWVTTLLLATYTPIPDNAWMGQANLLALLPALLGLAAAPRRPVLGGVLVGVAGMLKMSPALFLLYWVLRRQWRPVFAAAATAAALSVLALPLVDLDAQLRFYTEVLPGFGVGDYHGLSIPISLPANHSVPDLFDRVWDFPNPRRLSPEAHRASLAATVGLLALWAWRFRRPGDEPAALGALTVLMVVLPVYTYEHHLVFLLLAIGAAATVAPAWLFLPAYFFLAWPLHWLRDAQAAFPELEGVLRESKFLAAMALFAFCAWRAGRGYPRAK